MTKLIGRLGVAALKGFEKLMARFRKSPSTKTRRKQSSTNIQVEAWQQRCYELARENERLKVEAQDCRQQLVQLRVDGGAYGEGVHKRIGYMVGTFIPEGVLDKLRKHPERVAEFKEHIVDVMVACAVKRLLYINERGKQTAMVFMPYGTGTIGQRANLPVFETAQGFEMIVPEKLQDEIDKMLLEQAEDERRKLLRY